jgi:hypothetical protein
MSMEQRIRYLLAAALRADEEGDARTARILRRMAEESRPLVAVTRADRVRPTVTSPALACSAE